MVESTSISITPAEHADRHIHGGADPLTGDVRIDGCPAGMIVMWHGTLANIPTGWTLCDGTASTPDLRDTFVRGAANLADPGATGGSDTHVLSVAEMPAHHHTVPGSVAGGYGTTVNNGGGTDADTSSVGSGDAHNNMPAYYAIAYIMKT